MCSAEKVMHLLEKRVYSESGSSNHVKEQGTYIHFCDFLEELEGNLISQFMLFALVHSLQFSVLLC